MIDRRRKNFNRKLETKHEKYENIILSRDLAIEPAKMNKRLLQISCGEEMGIARPSLNAICVASACSEKLCTASPELDEQRQLESYMRARQKLYSTHAQDVKDPTPRIDP